MTGHTKQFPLVSIKHGAYLSKGGVGYECWLELLGDTVYCLCLISAQPIAWPLDLVVLILVNSEKLIKASWQYSPQFWHAWCITLPVMWHELTDNIVEILVLRSFGSFSSELVFLL